ncbi:MAG: site-2 protease family protein [Acidimicrobiales bacterium]
MSEQAAITGGERPTPSNTGAIARLVGAVAFFVVIAAVFHGLDVLLVVAALVLMVMLHEFGHFITAKASGMKVTEFFFGFGPRLWSIRRGETEYGVKAIPAGGYVRIVGMTSLEDVPPEDEARSYREATFPRRLLVAVSGSAMHFIIAFVLLFVMIAFTGTPKTLPNPEVGGLTAYSNRTNPAKAAGVRSGDFLVAVDGHHYTNVDRFITFIENHPNDTVSLTVRRSGRLLTLPVHVIDGRSADLVADHDQPEKQGSRPVGVIGVDLNTSALVTYPVLDSVPRAGVLLGRVVQVTGSGFAQVFSFHGLRTFVHEVASARNAPSTPTSQGSSSTKSSSSSSGELLSLPGAVDVAVQALQNNVSELLYILVAINLFVGMANLFPMLPLDGGHVAIAIYERIRSRPRRGRVYHADVRKLMPVAYAFLAALVVLGLSALYVNIVQPPSLPH